MAQSIDLLLHAIHSCLQNSQIIAIASGLLEDIASDHLLALDLAFEYTHSRLEFFPRDILGHGADSPNRPNPSFSTPSRSGKIAF
jgi:hypothetical protein